MRQREFEARHAPSWLELDALVARFDPASDVAASLPERHRALCHQLAVARRRGYSPDLVERLNALVLRTHGLVYRRRRGGREIWLRFVLVELPRSVRENARFVAVAGALFLLPGAVFGVGCWWSDDLLHRLMDATQVHEMEQMYAPERHVLGRVRDAEDDALMFAFYIRHNIGIAFQTFATGIVIGLGPALALVYNGAIIGGVAGHLTALGYGETFFPFVVTHGAFELPAIVLSGAAGLKLGFAWLVPGRRSRRDALREAGADAMRIVLGATAMLLLAAFLEAFWSSKTSLAPAVRYGVGLAAWLGVGCYFAWAGRSPRGADGSRTGAA